jgi:ABC-type Fe3+ transport system substrate-binding protein
LPEVLDQSKWWQGKHHYVDAEEKYIFIFEGSVQGGGISYNKNLVDSKELKYFWDLLDPKWKGKGVILHPRTRGMVSQSLTFLYHNSKLGPEFVRRLYGEMDVTISRDDFQMVDWLAAGKFAFNFFGRGVGTAESKGLPVHEFYAGSFKEGAFVNPLNGSVSLPSRAPHPNAAKVAINWLLSRAGQMAFQKATNNRDGTGADSMREDIPKEDVFPPQRRTPGVEYLFTARPEMMDMKPIIDLAEKALNEAKKK